MEKVSSCYEYGIVSGCDGNCPVLLAGDCKSFDDELLKIIKDDLLDEDIEELKKIYKYKQG